MTVEFVFCSVFFFQAYCGIRGMTGVQSCALPILLRFCPPTRGSSGEYSTMGETLKQPRRLSDD